MGSSLHQWESDPLFSAAEVVQDSADRMESLFRLLLHEQSLVHEEHPDPKLLLSIDYHRRDLATTLETAKWQLEDFERAVSLSSVTDKPQMRDDILSRHKQFVIAIREQIINMEKSLEDASLGDTMRMRNTEWINLNEQDRDGLALFLSGGNPAESFNNYNVEDSSIMKRFLDPTTAASSKDTASGLAEHSSKEIESLNINGISQIDHNFDSRKDNNMRKMGSHFSSRLGFEAPDCLQETSCNRHGEDESWDLEANEAKPKSFFHGNKLYGWWSRLNVFCFSNNLRTAYGSSVSRNYTKRLKDGEENRHSPSYIDTSHGAQGHHSRSRGMYFSVLTKVMYFCYWLGACRARYQRSPYHVQVNRHSIQLTLIILLAIIILGLLVSQIA
ncbi:hypothetical protein FH972_016608 [Carpinus fangiana]|uniref:Syntaxin 6/10/61 N-terminal domain-containing protein n=1 Tax=Carpinus fangiana TaxID=176857 RepID=A0A5N6RIG9_9ROSI|nr:hypothetical protein FH972_016608 [Carpinus fangiana]